MKEKKKYGQYMTPVEMADFMVSLISKDKTAKCLEPSSGKGVFIDSLKKNNFENIVGVEYDKNLIQKGSNVINTSFITCDFHEMYDVVIGNPPYIRWKNLEPELKKELENNELWNKLCNSLCDYSSIFIAKSIDALKDNGELIFITSDYWFSTTHAKNVRNYMLENGYVECIYHFNETPIFDDVSASFVIFKFVKNTLKSPVINVTKYFSRKKPDKITLDTIKNGSNGTAVSFEIPQFIKNEKWILAPVSVIEQINKYENSCNNQTIGQICEIGNGMVSGLDKAFQLPYHSALNKNEIVNTLKVIKAKHLESYNYTSFVEYIFLKDVNNEVTLKDKFEHFYKQLLKFKDGLLNRYNYGKNLKYWDWAFLRNFNLFSSKKDRIFVPCKERITNKGRFRFSVVPSSFYPTQDVTALFLKEDVQENIEYVTALLNSKYVFQWLNNKGTKKGDIVEFSEKPLSSIPYRKINFSDNKEKEIHDKIVESVNKYKHSKDDKIIEVIDSYIAQLI